MENDQVVVLQIQTLGQRHGDGDGCIDSQFRTIFSEEFDFQGNGVLRQIVFGVLGDVHIDRFIVGNGPMKTWNWEGPFEDVGPDDDIPTHWYGESGYSWWNCLLSDVDAMN